MLVYQRVNPYQIPFFSTSPPEVKCVLLGPSMVGKSALVARYCDETFVKTYLCRGAGFGMAMAAMGRYG